MRTAHSIKSTAHMLLYDVWCYMHTLAMRLHAIIRVSLFANHDKTLPKRRNSEAKTSNRKSTDPRRRAFFFRPSRPKAIDPKGPNLLFHNLPGHTTTGLEALSHKPAAFHNPNKRTLVGHHPHTGCSLILNPEPYTTKNPKL